MLLPMSVTDRRPSRLEDLAPEELERAQAAYRGAQESARAWRQFSPDPRHHDVVYWTLLTVLFVEPEMNRMTLIGRIVDLAGVSRSSAERAVREARARGFVLDRPAGKEVRYRLSDRLARHCVAFFRDFMSPDRALEIPGA